MKILKSKQLPSEKSAEITIKKEKNTNLDLEVECLEYMKRILDFISSQ